MNQSPKVSILVRVYDRIEDLKYNLQIIKRTWLTFNYQIIVVTNGYSDGYIIDSETVDLIDNLVILESNIGHKKGNSQLLIEGLKYISPDSDYTLILEADTWLYSDAIVDKYVNSLNGKPNTVWASAEWYDKDYSLAVDFAIIKTNYLKENSEIFDFEKYPECYIANYLRDTGSDFMYITENMPVHLPSYVFRYPYLHDVENKRFYAFPKSKMVTHHIEFLRNGMSDKKKFFNIISGIDYFADQQVRNLSWKRFKIQFWISLSQCFLKKSWFQNKHYREI